MKLLLPLAVQLLDHFRRFPWCDDLEPHWHPPKWFGQNSAGQYARDLPPEIGSPW